MNRQVYYWCTIIVIAVVVIIGFLTVSNNGNNGNTDNSPSINNEIQQNVGNENIDKNMQSMEEESHLTNYLQVQTVAMNKRMIETQNKEITQMKGIISGMQ